MIEVSGIRVPLKALDGSDKRELAECRRALARKLRIGERDLLHVERRRRSIDARKQGNVQLTFTLRAELAPGARLRADKGVKLVETAVASVNDIQQCVASLAGKVSGIWVPTDNVLASGSPILAKSAAQAKIPLVAGDLSFVQGGCLATVTVSHYELGRMTAEMGVEILEGRAKPGDMPIGSAKTTKTVWNKAAAEALGIKIPEGAEVIG